MYFRGSEVYFHDIRRIFGRIFDMVVKYEQYYNWPKDSVCKEDCHLTMVNILAVVFFKNVIVVIVKEKQHFWHLLDLSCAQNCAKRC